MKNNSIYIISGTKWLSISSIVSAMTYMLTLSILSRFLDKSDFGIIAILSFMQGLIQMLSNLGFSSAIMYKQNLTIEEFRSLYWIQLFVYIFIYIITVISAPLIADYYNEQMLSQLIPLFLISILLLGIGSLYGTLLHKGFEYRIIAIRDIVSSIGSLVIAILLAFFGYGVYSLVFFFLFRVAIVQIWNFIKGIKRIMPSFFISYKRVKPLMSIGLFQTGSNLVDYIGTSLDVLIIGKYLGTDTLGGYNLIKELVSKGLYLFNSIGNKVVLPIYSTMQNNMMSMGELYCKHIAIVASICFPICILLGGISSDLIALFFGNNYLNMTNILIILSVWGMLAAVGNPINNIVTATGRTDLSFVYTICRFIIVIPLLMLSVTYNITYVALSVLIGEIISFFLSWYLELYKTIQLKLHKFINSFFDLFVCSILLVILGQLITYSRFLDDFHIILRIIIHCVFLISLYSIAYIIFHRKMANLVYINLKKWFHKL